MKSAAARNRGQTPEDQPNADAEANSPLLSALMSQKAPPGKLCRMPENAPTADCAKRPNRQRRAVDAASSAPAVFNFRRTVRATTKKRRLTTTPLSPPHPSSSFSPFLDLSHRSVAASVWARQTKAGGRERMRGHSQLVLMPPPNSPPPLSLPPPCKQGRCGGGREGLREECSQCESDAVAGDAAAAALVVQLDVMQILTV